MRWQCRHLSPRWFVTNTLCAWGHLSNDWLPIFPTLSGEGYMTLVLQRLEPTTKLILMTSHYRIGVRGSEVIYCEISCKILTWCSGSVDCNTRTAAAVDQNTKFPKYPMHIYVKDWLYVVKLLHNERPSRGQLRREGKPSLLAVPPRSPFVDL